MTEEQISRKYIQSDPHNINDTAKSTAQGLWFMHIRLQNIHES